MTTTDTLIVEDLMLLLLDDRTGAIAGEGVLQYPLGGAILAELALAGLVEADGTTMFYGQKVHAVAGALPTDPLLRRAYDTIAERPRGVQTLLLEIGSELREQVLDRLVERHFLRRETKRTLGLFTTTRLPANDPQYEAALLDSVRAVLEDGATPDARTATLVALLSATGTLPQFDPRIAWSSRVYTRGKQLEGGNWVAEAVGLAVTHAAAAVSTASSIAVGLALGPKA
jgi:hypothetical protein